MNVDKIKKRKLLVVLICIVVCCFIFGCLFICILSKNNQSLVKNSINNFFEGISRGDFQYFKGLYAFLTENLILYVFIWVVGISIIGIIFSVFVLIYKSFLLGFSFSSIIYAYGFKGIIHSVIYHLPELFNLFLLFILVYYSIGFSVILFKYLFMKKDFNRILIVRRYVKLLLVVVGCMIINSIVSIFLIPNLLRMF